MAEPLELHDMQGILVRGYGNLRSACFVLLRIVDAAAARAWLFTAAQDLTTADLRPADSAVNVGVTSAGLLALGLASDVLNTFPQEFVEGMVTPYRSRILGDEGASAPSTWAWGGTATEPIDLALFLYAVDDRTLAALRDGLVGPVSERGLREITILETVDLGDKEHFGFHDGISQPIIEGLSRTGPPANTVKAGEFILGYTNEYGLSTERPVVSGSGDQHNLLPAISDGSGNRDLGRNGTYLVFRQLRQDVPGFQRFLDESTRSPDGSSNALERDRLAARMVGRWPSGAPLVLSPDLDNPGLANENNFDYFYLDADGHKCPLGAHIRRTNPRDSLDPRPGTARSFAINRRHRIVRRGREYGRPLESGASPDGEHEEQGLHFICLAGNIARQFEFVQHTWVNNPKFHGLYDDPDPLIGSHPGRERTFTMQGGPLRRRLTGVPDFVTVRGGAYFFVPGVRALRYLASAGR